MTGSDSSDPYCWPGTSCLINKLGLRDPNRLHIAEFIAVSARTSELRRDILPGEYDMRHFRAFHHYLFRDIYSWAGETRTVQISKSGLPFCHPKYVDPELQALLGQLAREDLLAMLPSDTFLVLPQYLMP